MDEKRGRFIIKPKSLVLLTARVMFDDEGKKCQSDNGIFVFLIVKDFDKTENIHTSTHLMSNANIAAIIISSEPKITIPRIGADSTKYVSREPLVFYQKTSDSTFANNKLEILYTITIPKDVYDIENWNTLLKNNLRASYKKVCE